MALLLAFVVGTLVAGGVWLMLRPRSYSVVLGLTMVGYAVNMFILTAGRVGRQTPPLTLEGATALADPLPQALVLTAIVIGLGMTAFLIALALRGLAANTDAGDDADRLGEGPFADELNDDDADDSAAEETRRG
jgi:multicomponent K+:H+ antiporter subunit C